MTPITCVEARAYPMKKALRRWQTSGKPTLGKRLVSLLLPWVREHQNEEGKEELISYEREE